MHSCFILLFTSIITFAFYVCKAKSCPLVVFEWQYYAFKIQGLCIGEIILGIIICFSDKTLSEHKNTSLTLISYLGMAHKA